MPRYSIPTAPETSKLVEEAPPNAFADFLLAGQFEKIFESLGGAPKPAALAEDDVRDMLRQNLRALSPDRRQQIEYEARRITKLAEQPAAELLLRMAEDAGLGELPRQRDELAKSLWCRRHAARLFANVERAVQVQHFRDKRKLFTAYEIKPPLPLSADAVDTSALGEEIAGRLHYDDGCNVEAVELPRVAEDRRSIMIVVTSAGAFSSQKAFENRQLKTFYYRPPDEVVLVYTPADGRLESCAQNADTRRLASEIFSETALGHDLSGKALTRKTYDLSRFRRSLRLPIPSEESSVVTQARLTMVEVTLGSWARKLSLKVTPSDDIEAFARKALGGVNNFEDAGFIAGLEFNVGYVSSNSGKEHAFSFKILGRYSCSLQGESDPERRELGFRLLEHWGVLKRFRDLDGDELAALRPLLLQLYDHAEDLAPGSLIADHGVSPEPLERVGYLSREGVSDVVLLDDELFGEHAATVEGGAAGAANLDPAPGIEGPASDAEDLTRFRIDRELIREEIERMLEALPRTGRSRLT